MSSLKVGLTAGAMWLLASLIAFAAMPMAIASLVAVLGAFLVPVAIYVGSTEHVPIDVSRDNLERVFGGENVSPALNYRLIAVPGLVEPGQVRRYSRLHRRGALAALQELH